MVIVLALLISVFVLAVKPYTEKLHQRNEIFNNICLLAITYHFPLFTNFLDPSRRYVAGYTLIFIVLINYTLNFFKFATCTVFDIIRTYKRRKIQ